ncbi:MAG: response regulator, partial [Gemmatimonadota bacterium]|nr:response regulator [Gemmatimonadota bacterium]
MEFKRILVVDDEPLMRDFLVEALQRKKYYVDVAEDGWKAIEKIKNDYFHLVITDNRHPGPCGVEIIKFTKKHSAETEVIMITAFGEVENAVEAMKMGAFCYLFKPFQADEIVLRVECALEHQKPRSKRILVVDDEPLMREFLLNVLKGKYVVDSVCDGAQAIEKIKADYFDLVITDIRMPEVNGMEVLQAVKKHSTETEVIMITSFGEVENAVTAMKIGAFHYLQKPFQADEVVLLVERALERQKSREENCTLR